MDIAIEIGGTKLQIGIGNATQAKIDRVIRLDIDPDNGAEVILAKIESALSFIADPQNIAIGFGGPIDHTTGLITNSHQVKGWSGLNLKDWFKERYKARIYVENDANVAALGEYNYGAGKEYKKVFYITLGSGVGGGLVINGKLYYGNTPGETEVGLIKMDKDGNSLESLCSGWALNAKIREKIKHSELSLLKTLVRENKRHESKFIKEAVMKGDALAIEIFDEYCDDLAFGLSHVTHLLNPEVIVIGGGVSLIGETLKEKIRLNLPNYLSSSYLPGPEVNLAALGEQVVLYGALSLIESQ